MRWSSSSLIRFVGLPVLGIVLMGASECCCQEILDSITKKYDYIKDWECKSVSGGSGCFTTRDTGVHVKIESSHEAKVKEACKYKGSKPAVQTKLGLQVPAGTKFDAAEVDLTFNGEAVTFVDDEVAAAELAERFGGEWVVFEQQNAVYPSTNDVVMDRFTFSYSLAYTRAMPGNGVALPQNLDYNHALLDPETNQWVFSTTHTDVTYPEVVISVVDDRGGQLPVLCPFGDTMLLGTVYVKNTARARAAGLTVEAAVYVDGSTELRRSSVATLGALVPWALVEVKDAKVDLSGLPKGDYVVTIEARSGGKKIGEKMLSVRITGIATPTSSPPKAEEL